MKSLFNKIKRPVIITTLCFASLNIHANEFRIDDFRFAMNDSSFSSWNTAGGAQPIGSGPYGTLIENTYQGTNTTNELVAFNFFTKTVHVYTAASNGGASQTAAGTIPGGPVPTIDLSNGTADLSAWFAEWNGTDFNQGNNNNHAACSSNPDYGNLSDVATVVNNFDGTYTISWNSCINGGSFDGQIGYWRLEVTCTTCPTTILDPNDSLTVTQAGYTTNTVGKSDGDVVVSSSKGNNPPNTTYTWNASDPSIVDIDANQGTFTFDPTNVPEGQYTISHSYEDTTTYPPHVGTGSIQINVTADSVANYIDSDNDGIPDSQDSGSLTEQQLQSVYGNSTTHVLETSAGKLKIGSTAFCVSSGAKITHDDIINHAGANCAAVVNASDDKIKRIGVGGFFDFEITGLTQGQTVNVVIPLYSAIPKNPTYRKYFRSSGWKLFEINATDSIASANSLSSGVCPAHDSGRYSTGLTEGHKCIRLAITDGGVNDTDGLLNGAIKDPGGVAEIEGDVEADLASGCSLSGKSSSIENHMEWPLLAAFIIWLGVTVRRNRTQN